MIAFRPDSSAAILRAAHILKVRIVEADVGEWTPVSTRFQEREAVMDLRLEGVLKGSVSEEIGAKIQVRIRQTENRGLRFAAVPGVWSRVNLDPGGNWLAFANAGCETAAEILVEPSCFRVFSAAEAESDVRLVDEANAPEISVALMVDRAWPQRASFGPLFAQYLVDRVKETIPDDMRGFAAVLRVMKATELPNAARYLLLSGTVSSLLLMDPAPLEFVGSFTRSAFQLLRLPQAAALHDNLIVTYLPNLLGIEGGARRRMPAEVFPYPPSIAAALAMLEEHPLVGAGAPLLNWLRL